MPYEAPISYVRLSSYTCYPIPVITSVHALLASLHCQPFDLRVEVILAEMLE
jgi:hypothetical protein